MVTAPAPSAPVRRSALLDQPVVTAAIADGFDYANCSPAIRRSFVASVLDRIEIKRDGAEEALKTLQSGTRIGETSEQFAVRREAVLRESFANRVTFVARP